jgi:hypothetical protein
MLPTCRFDHRGDVGLLVYLDICCFNRPFNQQSQTLVRLQTEAKLAVQHGDDRIVVADQIDFIRYWQGDDDENRVIAETGRGPGADCRTPSGGSRTFYRGLTSGAVRLHPMERRPMAGRDRRRAGRTGACAAGAPGDTGVRLVRCRLLKNALGANQGPLIRKTEVYP